MSRFYAHRIAKAIAWFDRIPGHIYLWLAVLIFGASSAVTRKITELGAQHFMNGENPISLCNVLFVGNLCAFLVLLAIHRQKLRRHVLKQLTRQEWVSLSIVAVLAGAIAPGLIFQALATTQVTSVILVGRLESPLTLALSVWLLQERVNRWQTLGAIAAFAGVVLTVVLQPAQGPAMQVHGLAIGLGELMAAVGAVALAISTIVGKQKLGRVPIGLYTIVRTGLGTIIFFLLALILYGQDHFMGVFSPFLWKWMLVYGVIIVVVGQSFWLTGLRASSISMASIISSFVPIAGVIAAYFILGEVPTQAQYIGGSVILFGLLLNQFGQPTHSAPVEPANMTPTEQKLESKMGFKGI